jgi:hypothetical protein
MTILTKKPCTIDALISEIDVSLIDFKKALCYGEQTNYFGTFKSFETEKEIIWTPLYWAGNMDRVLTFLKRQTYERFEVIEEMANRLISYPGVPYENISKNEGILNSGIGCGLFPSVGVIDSKGNKCEYVFAATPQFEIDPKQDIFEKARLIVACVRHGQHHAEISRIKYPVQLLRSLREGRIKPHSYAKIQYALLVTNRICKYEEDDRYGTKTYKPVLIDTPENIIAMDVAEELLKGIGPVSGSVDEPGVKELLINGAYIPAHS